LAEGETQGLIARGIAMEESSAESLKATLELLKRQVSAPTFRDTAKSFDLALKESKGLTRALRAELWEAYQSIWADRKAFVTERQQRSDAAAQSYRNELSALDFSYDGAPLGQTFANWEHVGEKVRAARANIKAMQARLKEDRELLPPDRKVLNEAISTVWSKIEQSGDMAFDFHRKQADSLFNDAERAVDQLKPRDATPIFKAAQVEINSLWLRSKDRTIYRGLLDDLWVKLTSKKEDSKRRYDDWRERQEQGRDKLREALDKALDRRRRARENKEANLARLAEARSRSHSERVTEWIREDEEKEAAIERSIVELEEKMRDADEKLR
jgi:hypothetical protein